MYDNLLLNTDSYKHSHHLQYPPKMQKVFSYMECREGGEFRECLFFGLQYILSRYLCSPVTKEQIDVTERLINTHLGSKIFNRKGWEHILNKHSGYLPVVVHAVAEGTVLPVGNVLFTVENTDPEVPWLTSFLETLLLRVWYPITVATVSLQYRRLFEDALERTGTSEDIALKLHDFGCRGVSSVESAAIGGLAHLVNFKGTDTLPAFEIAERYYSEPMPGFSIPASEHSTMTSWGRGDELGAFQNMLTSFPKGPVAIVADSYDLRRAVQDIVGKVLRDQIIQRDGIVVIRPDSGHPPTQVIDTLRALSDAFGYVTNEKGFKVLQHVRVIQGDGIDLDMAGQILRRMEHWGWSVDNITMGAGGGLLQKLNRDTLRCAMKASWIKLSDGERDIFKNPSTDPTKKSKMGRLQLLQTPGGAFFTTREDALTPVGNNTNQLVEVFRDGKMKKLYSLSDVRARARETCKNVNFFKQPQLWEKS